MPFLATQVTNRPERYRITIPNNTGTGATLWSLLQAAGMTSRPVALKILGKLSDGTTDRPAFTVASPRNGVANDAAVATDFTTHGQAVPSGADYYEPAENDVDSYVRSLSGSTIDAQVVVYR